MRPEEAVKKYGKKLFLDPDEVSEYLRGKKRASKVLVIVLKDLRRYRRGYKPKRFITVAGKRLTDGSIKRYSGWLGDRSALGSLQSLL